MRRVPGGPDEARRRLEAIAQEQAAVLVPRLGYPIYGLSAPAFEAVTVSGYSTSNGEWRSVALMYGPRADSDEAEPRVKVTTMADTGGMTSRSSSERSPDAVSHQDVERVTVTVETWGIAIDEVTAAPVPDLRPVIETALAQRLARIERLRREPKPPPPPPPDLPPAEGAAALRALADHTLAAHREISADARERLRARRAGEPAGRPREHGLEWGRLRSALWQRAVQERQRLGGVSAEAADEDVTSAVNHLGQLLERAPWFESDARLREAAIDETLRFAMLGETVPSFPAQQLWTAQWSAHMARIDRAATPEAALAEARAREADTEGWLAAWAAWTATA